jgi:hypothetical protein
VRERDRPAVDRLADKTDRRGPDECWPWTGYINRQGYGRTGYKGRRSVPAQQAVYDCLAGPVPDGMVVDHTCHNRDETCPGGITCIHRRCVNPAHFEAVTQAENVARGRSFSAVNARVTVCPHGHPYDASNTYTAARRRYCIACYTRRNGHPPVRRSRLVQA